MAPGFRDGDLAVVSVRAFRIRDPARFEVVLARNEAGARDELKRVVGLPGERVQIQDGGLLVDGVPVPEPHLAGPMPDDWRFEWRPAPGEYVVLGDNRTASTDSRHYGPVSRDDIIGPVIRRF